jgi:hypothetical protein
MPMYRTFLRLNVLAVLAVLAVLIAAPALAEPPAKVPADSKNPDAPAKPGDDKAQSDTLPDDVANRFVEFFDKLTSIVVDNEKDCAKMAAGVNAHIDANQGLLKLVADAKSQNKSLPPEQKEKIAKKSSEAIAPAMMKKCSNDRPVMTAFMRIAPQPKSASEIADKEKARANRIERKKAKSAAK